MPSSSSDGQGTQAVHHDEFEDHTHPCIEDLSPVGAGVCRVCHHVQRSQVVYWCGSETGKRLDMLDAICDTGLTSSVRYIQRRSLVRSSCSRTHAGAFGCECEMSGPGN